MSDADLLRRAAARMKELAEAATPGPWSTVPGASNVWRFPDTGTPALVVPGNGRAGHVQLPDAAHIAVWSPTVALAVAAWLEAVADNYAIARHGYWSVRALAVARAFLREADDDAS